MKFWVLTAFALAIAFNYLPGALSESKDDLIDVSPFKLVVDMALDANRTLQKWVEAGSRSRIVLLVEYADELNLPKEAQVCKNKTGNPEKGGL